MPVASIVRRKPGRKPKDHGPEKRAAALAVYDSCHSLRRTSAETGIPLRTIREWVVESKKSPEQMTPSGRAAEPYRAQKRDDLSVALADTAWAALAQVQATIGDASARDAAVVAGISLQRKADLDGLPQRPSGDVHPSLAGRSPEELRAMRASMVSGTVVDALPLPDSAPPSLPAAEPSDAAPTS